MSSRDPLASPTLAHLYIQQGHLGRARQVLDAVLEDDPLQGHALAIQERLRHTSEAALTCELRGDMVHLRWQKVSADAGLYLVMMTTWVERGAARLGVESLAIPKASGKLRVKARRGAASFVACIGAVQPGRGFVADAVADPVTW